MAYEPGSLTQIAGGFHIAKLVQQCNKFVVTTRYVGASGVDSIWGPYY